MIDVQARREDKYATGDQAGTMIVHSLTGERYPIDRKGAFAGNFLPQHTDTTPSPTLKLK